MANDDTQNVVLDFKMNGQVQFANTVKDINTIMNTASKQFKAQVAAMDENASTSERLAAEQQKLQIQSEAAAKRTQMLTEQLQKMKDGGQTSGAAFDRLVGKVADAQRVESNLQNALNDVNAKLTEHGQEANAAKDDLGDLQQVETELDQKMKLAASSAKLENTQLADGASDAQKNEAAHRQLTSQMALAQQKVSNLEQQLDRTKTAYGENSNEATKMATKLNKAKTDVAGLETAMSNLDKSSDDASDGLDQVNEKLDLSNAMEASENIAGLGDKVVDLATDLGGVANDYASSQNKIQASMGGTEAQAANLNRVVKAVFEGGVVDSVDEANEAVLTVKSAFSDLNNTDLTKLTNSFIQISQKTGTDVQENVNAAQQLMKNFGVTGQQALDLIAQGYQNNLNKNGDFLDTLNEYPVQFKSAGYSASEMLSIIDSGMKSGTFNTDKAADAIKEMQIRMGDGTFEQNMGSFSKQTQSMFGEWKKGKATTADVAASIGADLEGMSPAKQQAAISLLGSQFEDLGVKGSLSLLEVGNSYDQAGGKADSFNKKTPGQEFEAALRKLQAAFIPLIQQLTPAVTAVTNFVSGLSKMPEPLKVIIGVIGGVLVVFSQVLPIISSVAAILPIFGIGAAAAGAGAGAGAVGIGALMTALLPIIGVIAAVIAAITAVVLVIKNWGTVVTWLKGVWSTLLTFFQPILAAVRAQLQAFQPVLTIFKQYFSNTINNIKLALNGFISVVRGILNILVGVFTGNGAKIKAGFQAVFQGLINIGAAALRQVINTVASGFAAVVNTVSAVFGKARGIVSAVWSAIKSFFSSGLSSVLGTVSRVFGSIVNAISHPMETAKSLVSRAIQAIKGFFNFHISWPHIPLPHFSLSGKFNPLKGQIPHVAVDWYAQGAIMTQPTMFGMNNGRAQVGGEAGPEGVIPLTDNTWDKMGAAIAAHMPGQGPIYLQVDGTTFARLMNGYFDAVGGNVMSLQDRGLTQ